MVELYLGREASSLLKAPPFDRWPVEKSLEEDLEEPILHYVFPHHGMELRCDRNDRINTIFLRADTSGHFEEELLDIPANANRGDVLRRFGIPAKSGNSLSDPVLGRYGPWDRFNLPRCVVHVQYRVGADDIEMITLMRPDAVPA
ncbi:MAG TPA: hypothetical protein VF669_13240 [Tepidisphaeraceae bacterium]|jgi:hypothetical protein